MEMKIAVLSNINIDAISRMLKKEFEIYDGEGYGNEIGLLVNPISSLNIYSPDLIFLLEDIVELLNHTYDLEIAKNVIDNWFADFEIGIKQEVIYYISDGIVWGSKELDVIFDRNLLCEIENVWNEQLKSLMAKYKNVRLLTYRDIIIHLGVDNCFASKMWYMGRIKHSVMCQKKIVQIIKEHILRETRVPKKVLLLDLDNTLWGGLAGENDLTPILLSEDHLGMPYKDLQRVIKQMKEQGVVLGIVSKNNESDAMQIISNHPHMVLSEGDFAIKRINWDLKQDNILSIAQELNIGIDSIVFFDDNPVEREMIKESLSEVIVPDFPENPEDLAKVMCEIWRNYFSRSVITNEDLTKTEQYIANSHRNELMNASSDFESFLKRLDIRLILKDEKQHVDRILQLLNKTNQFNLRTNRYTRDELQRLMENVHKEVLAFQVMDKYGDEGIVSVVIVDMENEPFVTDFVMSCRVMGRKIENAIIEYVEHFIREKGKTRLRVQYKKTKKNKPVMGLFDGLGYVVDVEDYESKSYHINLEDGLDREYQLEFVNERRVSV